MQTKLPAPMDDLLTGPVPSLVVKQVRLVDAMLTKLEGARFKIVLPDGSEFTHNLEEAPPPKESSRKAYNHVHAKGQLAALYLPHISTLEIGDLAVYPAPEGIPIESLRSASAGWASKNWGPGNHESSINKATSMIEFMRTG